MGYVLGPTLAVNGEAEYNAAMKRVRESMTYVKAEAQAAISVFNKNEQSVQSLTAQINQSKKAMDVQRQAVKAAEDALERMRSNGVDESSTAYKRMEANLNNAKAALNKTDNEVKDLEKDLKKGGNETKTFGAKISEFASSSVGSVASVAGAFALAKEAVQALWNMIKESAQAADALGELSLKTGIATDELQKLEYAGERVEVETDAMARGQARVVKAFNAAQKAGQDYITVTDGLTVSTKDANGNVKDSYQLFLDTVGALGSMASETEREAAAQAIFGKSYQDLMPLIKAGSGALEKYGDEAENVGAVVDSTTIAALGKLDDKLKQTSAVMKAEGMKASAALAPITDWFAQAWQDVVKFTSAQEAAIRLIQTFNNLTYEQARAVEEQGAAYANARYVMGYSDEQMSDQLTKLGVILYKQGVEPANMMTEALNILAQGMDATAYSTQYATEKQGEFDAAITAALENYKTKNAEYLAEVKRTADGYISSMGSIFDGFKINTDVTGEQLLKNLKSQEKGIVEWATNIDALAKRNIDQGLLDSLRKMGPAAAGEIAALNSLSDPKLRDYVASWKNMSSTATAEAEKANQDMKYQTLKALDEMKYAIEAKDAGMGEVAKSLGLSITDGVIAGLDSTKINNKIAKMARDALETARRTLDSHSPSKKFIKVGESVPDGIVVGIQNKMADVMQSMKDMTGGMVAKFSNVIPVSFGAAASRPVQTTITNNTREIIRDSGIVVQFTGDTHINNGQDIDTIAQQLAVKVKRAMAAQGA